MALIALPVAGALAHAILFSLKLGEGKARKFVLPVFAALTLGCALAMFGQRGEAIVAGWTPVSLTGAPLLISISPEAVGIIFALACVKLARAVYGADETHAQRVASSLAFGSIALAALSANMPALFVGVGLADLFAAISAASAPYSTHRAAILRNAIFQMGALLFLAMGFLISLVSQSSLYFPLANLSLRSEAFFAGALLLRFIPLGFYPGAVENRISIIASLIVLMRLLALQPNLLGAGVYAPLLAVEALVLLRAAFTANEETRLRATQIGALLLALLPRGFDSPAWVAGVAIAWALAALLMEHPARLARLVGALGLFGLPPTLGLVLRASAAPQHPLALAVWVVGLALLAYNLALLTRGEIPQNEPSPGWLDRSVPGWVSFVALALPLLGFGVAPQWVNLPTLVALVAGHGVVGWVGMAFAALVGVGAYALAPRWRGRMARAHGIANSIFKLGWLERVVEGSIERMSRPFRVIYGFLESDGVLLWAVVVVLLAVLIARPGGP